MGGGSSTPRKVTVERGEETEEIKVSDEYHASKIKDAITTKSDDTEFLRMQAVLAGRIQELEAKNADFYKASVEELGRVVEVVEQKYMKPALMPVCAMLQESVMRCYLENQRHSLNCAAEVRAFNTCVQAEREKILT
jgi:hypothetical protein